MGRTGPTPDEADLSTQEAPPRQGARLPLPDEVSGRPADAGAASRPRPEEALGLTSTRGVPRPRLAMIVRPSDFEALQRDGVSSGTPIVAVRVRRTDLAETRFGISTSKRVGKAVVRNRARRRIREVLRASLHLVTPGWDVLVVARPPIVEADRETLAATIDRLLRKRGVIARTEGA